MSAPTIPQASVLRALRFTALLLLLQGLCAPEILAQKPWVGWHGPLSDGIMGFRFGMDRRTVREVAQGRRVKAAPARGETLRYTGSFLSEQGELVLEFAPDESRPGQEVLTRIRIGWEGIAGGGGRPQAMFESLSTLLEERYGPAMFRRDATMQEISSGYRDALLVFEGPQMQAQLSLKAAGKQSLRLMLLLVSPQLDPGFQS